MVKLLVVKIGGNILDDEPALKKFLADFTSLPGHKLLVHGGGKIATELSGQLGIKTEIVDGRRITNKATIRVVTMACAGWINKSLTASLLAQGCPAIGLCGADAHLLPAVKRPAKEIDYGWVGDILQDKVNAKFLSALLQAALLPVIAPITSDSEGNLLNINADTVAQALAQAMSPLFDTTLIYCFEKNGLLRDVNDENSVIEQIDAPVSEMLKREGIISKGMIPKIDNALNAAKAGVKKIVIGHAIFIRQMAEQQKGYGTSIVL